MSATYCRETFRSPYHGSRSHFPKYQECSWPHKRLDEAPARSHARTCRFWLVLGCLSINDRSAAERNPRGDGVSLSFSSFPWFLVLPSVARLLCIVYPPRASPTSCRERRLGTGQSHVDFLCICTTIIQSTHLRTDSFARADVNYVTCLWSLKLISCPDILRWKGEKIWVRDYSRTRIDIKQWI